MEARLLDIGSSQKAARHRLTRVASTGYWDLGDTTETKIHRIHAYPAKFPAFLTTKALAYARDSGIEVRRIADVFCGCGTVAYEARRAGLEFWGCDINPVATLIARAKSADYQPRRLRAYTRAILAALPDTSADHQLAGVARERLGRWYSPAQFNALARLLNSIDATVPARSEYRTAFHCAFSAILKSTSRWRQRSTKPALDPGKLPANAIAAFTKQCEAMALAWTEAGPVCAAAPQIHNANVMTIEPPQARVDMIVTSPPYVTSYEYADLHQLSSLWLGYTDDYRHLRRGSIGSAQHDLNFRREFSRLNDVGLQVVFSIFDKDRAAAQSIAKYYLDMQEVAKRCYTFLVDGGVAVFVIGNTEYSGVPVDNAAHLAESLFNAGFRQVRADKRRISNKLHTPFRDDSGRFSRSRTEKHIYSEEFVLIAHK